MKPRSAKAKGNALENHVADQIRALRLDSKASRSIGSGSGTREKADIDTSLTVLGRNVGIECKNHKSLRIQEWWRQTAKIELLGREPILVFKEHREPFEETKAVVRLDTLLQLIRSSKEPKTLKDDNREVTWLLKQLRQIVTKLLKHLEK